MGCGASSARVAGSRAKRLKHRMILESYFSEAPQSPAPEEVEISVQTQLRESVARIIQGIGRLPQIPGMLPILCLTETTCPIYMLPLCKPNGERTSVVLPAAGAAFAEKGRVVAIGHIAVLTMCTSNDTEAAAFFENVLRFAGGGLRNSYRVLLCGLPPKLEQVIRKNIRSFDFPCDVAPDFEFTSRERYQVVVVTTAYAHPEKVYEFLKVGGGVVVAGIIPAPGDRIDMRPVLLRCGIGIPDCQLVFGAPGKDSLPVRYKRVDELLERAFPGLCDRFIEVTAQGKKAALEVIDPLVTTIRYHLTTMKPNDSDLLGYLWAAGWKFLDDTGGSYIPGEGVVCPQLVHSITYVLISELLNVMDPKYLKNWDRSMPFPGRCGNIELQDFATTVEIPCDGWFSTGLYLPPGVVAVVSLESIPPSCEIQIGAHSECILSRRVPWKRWPTVITHFAIEKNELRIASPFGGIIYITTYDFDSQEPLRVSLNFHGITRYPMFMVGNPQVWEETAHYDVPWGEMETQCLVFVMPSERLRAIPDKDEVCMWLDSLVVSVLQFTSDESMCLYRVVFDIDVLEQGSLEIYPIFMKLEAIEALFFSRRPSVELFQFLQLVAERSLPTDGFPEEALLVFARLAVFVTFKKVWPELDPLEFVPSPCPGLWDNVLRIYMENEPDMIPKAIDQMRQAMAFVPIESMNMYRVFVKKVNATTKRDYTEDLFKNVEMYAGQMLLAGSSQSLLEFQLDKDETSPLPS